MGSTNLSSAARWPEGESPHKKKLEELAVYTAMGAPRHIWITVKASELPQLIKYGESIGLHYRKYDDIDMTDCEGNVIYDVKWSGFNG